MKRSPAITASRRPRLRTALVGLAAASAAPRTLAGGEDGGQVTGGPTVAGQDTSCPFPGRAQLVGEAGQEARHALISSSSPAADQTARRPARTPSPAPPAVRDIHPPPDSPCRPSWLGRPSGSTSSAADDVGAERRPPPRKPSPNAGSRLRRSPGGEVARGLADDLGRQRQGRRRRPALHLRPAVVLPPHAQDRAHPREAVEHHREERPVSEPGQRARVDVFALPRPGGRTRPSEPSEPPRQQANRVHQERGHETYANPEAESVGQIKAA